MISPLRYFLAAALLFSPFAMATSASAYTDAQIQQIVGDKIMERQPTDTPQWWQGLGENAPGVLIGMYTSETNIYHRIRIVQGLGWMDSPEAVSFVEQQAQDTDTDVIRNAAIRALGNGQGAKEEDFISKFLKNPDPQTRLAAAESLQKIKDPRAQDLVAAYMKEEKTPWLLDKLSGKQLGATGLSRVSSSEDRISSDFEGTWRGYWVSPKDHGSGMQTAQVVLQFKAPSAANSIQGNLTAITHKVSARDFQISDGTGKGVNVAGNLTETPAPLSANLSTSGTSAAASRTAAQPMPSLKPTQFEFQSTLSRMKGVLIMEMRIPSMTAVLVMKKD
jgi:hypothetical protein